ncbi:MAG: hypothetical protein JWN78_2143 [Bacteroidota bacterium]|nr:hypothetical protein [Bacteroidota bacterium]
MKKVFFFSVAAILLSIAACKKSSTTTSTPSVVGYWTGSTGFDGIEFLFRSNSTVRVFVASADSSLADKYEGTYTVGSDSVRWHWTFGSDIRSAAAKMNSTATFMAGTQGNGTSSAGVGTFTATK